MSWALLAVSAIADSSSAIMAASEDICEVIANDGEDELFIFPNFETNEAGMYLWIGVLGEDISSLVHKKLSFAESEEWIKRNGEPS